MNSVFQYNKYYIESGNEITLQQQQPKLVLNRTAEEKKITEKLDIPHLKENSLLLSAQNHKAPPEAAQSLTPPVINRVKQSTLLMPLPRLQVENIENDIKNYSHNEHSFSPMNGERGRKKEGAFSPIHCEQNLFKRSHDAKMIEEEKETFTAAHKQAAKMSMSIQ